MKTTITSNTTKIAERYRRMARNLPGVIDRAVRELVEDDALPLFENTVRTWRNKPQFRPIKRYQSSWGVRVDPLYPFEWINRGTRVRYATMSKDWKSKTKPGIIASYQGSGRMLFVSRKHPRPGIHARNFSDIILRRVQQRAAGKVREAILKASYGEGVGI